MQIKLCIFFFVSIGYLSLSNASSKTGEKQEWLSLINQLNEDLDASPQASVQQDLFKTYKDELSAINTEWTKLARDKNSKSYNQEKNTFYMESIQKKSQSDFTALQKASQTSTSEVSNTLLQSVLEEASDYSFINLGNPSTTAAEIAIGFCFYKALMVHYFLRQKGVSQKDIKKVFAVGPLIYPPLVWKFHVAVAVQSKGHVWVIDPLVKKVSTLEDWKKELQKFSAENPYPRLRFYVTDPQKFLPNSKEYSYDLISHTKTKKYNPAFLKYLKKKGQPTN